MNRHRIPISKVHLLRNMFIKGNFNKVKAAYELNVSRKTVTLYVAEFRKIEKFYPDKLMDFGFFMPVQTPEHRPTGRYLEFESVLPYLLREYEDQQIIAVEIWKEYKLIYPEGYTQTVFKDLLIQYCLDHNINRQERVYFPEDEQMILTEWRNGNDHRRWQIAVALQDAAEYIPIVKT